MSEETTKDSKIVENKKTDLELVKEFIFNDDVQHILSNINDNLMDFNILEITGMRNQEIKHSNILGWLFDDSEHNLEYHILDNFLKKVIEENREDYKDKQLLENLQSYIYLAEKKKAITIYREKDNIDLLIVDEANKVVITIENKVDASERTDGDDGGQLQKYEDIINKKYDESYKRYFLFLTINLEEPSKLNWLKASHYMVTNVIANTLKTKEITSKTEIILESYVDLLKRNGVVADTRLEELCKEIWNKKEYKSALESLFNYKPDLQNDIAEYLQSKITSNTEILLLVSQKRYTSFCDVQWKTEKNTIGLSVKGNLVVYYLFTNMPNSLKLTVSIGPSDDAVFRKEIYDKWENSDFTKSYSYSNKHSQIYKLDILKKDDILKEFDEIKKIIDTKLETFFQSDGDFYKNRKLFNELPT